ncbi:MAG: hypothetical protein IKN24_09055 [Lachnospiraceae bacterium]|nr:hypothetical protein [Lachnospiraceae bacterium]
MLDELWSGLSDFMGDTFSSILESILNATIFKLCYNIEIGLCGIINILSQLFKVFAGLDQVRYGSRYDILINIMFSNRVFSNIYWAMALIGVALTVGFTIWSVVRKSFDSNGKIQDSHAKIVIQGLKSIGLIVSMTLIMSVVINVTNELMNRVDAIFNNAWHLHEDSEREFTEEEYSAMGRVLATIGNYSMVSSSTSRYNINLCYNSIRGDMEYLQNRGVFEYSYHNSDGSDGGVASWQAILSTIAKSGSLSRDVKVDIYYPEISHAITDAMEYLRNNKIVSPVDRVKYDFTSDGDSHLDRMVFLMGTLKAARNPEFNTYPKLDDALRGPYYYGETRSIYDIEKVTEDFNIGFPTDYILVWIAAIAVIFDLVVIILNCIARIFNLLFLYIISPPIIAASPLDGGGKFKQWTIAFLVQSLAVFGTVIAMRLLLIYLPVVMDPQLVLFESAALNALAKFALVLGGFEASKKATALLTGILSDSAGWQAVQAGDMSSSAGKAISTATGIGKAVGGKALGIAKGTASFAFKPATNLVSRPFKFIGDKWKKLGTGGAQNRAEKNVKEQLNTAKAKEAYLANHPNDRKYFDGPKPPNGNDHNNNNNNNNDNNQNNQNNNRNPDRQDHQAHDDGDAQQHHNNPNDALNRRREQMRMGPEGRQEANQEMNRMPVGRHQEAPLGGNRPSLDRPPLPANNRRNSVPRRNNNQGNNNNNNH